jgi:hypothetical protein
MNDMIFEIQKTTEDSSIWHCQICFTMFQSGDCGYVLPPTMASGKCFTDLPDEVLLKIFSNLNTEDLAMSIQHVNSHWKNVSQDGSLWKTKIFSPEYKMSDEEIVRHLMNMPALRAFSPSRGTNTKDIVHTLCKYCRDIRHIQFKWPHKMSVFRLHEILQKCPQIENLSISLPKETHQLSFAHLLGQFKKLTTLSLIAARYTIAADGVLRAISDGCPSLLHFDLGYFEFQEKDIKYLLKKKGQKLLSLSVRCYISTVTHRLLTECVNLEYLYYEQRNEDLPSTYIQYLSNLSKLHTLTLLYFTEGQTQNVSTVFKNQTLCKLIKLQISFCVGFDGTSLTLTLTKCPQLQSLTLQHCELADCGFQYIGICKNLQVLDIDFNFFVTDKSMEYVGAGCPNLNHLNIGHCPQLTDKSIEYICTGCPKLRNLNIQSCHSMTDDVIKHICKSKKLNVLTLSWNYHLLGTNFLLIPSNLVNLTELHVHNCFSLDEKCMDKLKGEMPHLNIEGNYTNNEENINLGDATFFISQLL